MKCILALFDRALSVAVGRWFDGWTAGCGGGAYAGVEGGDFRGGAAHEEDLFFQQGGEGEGGVFEGRLEESYFGGDEEFLVGGGDGERGGDVGGEVGEGGGGGEGEWYGVVVVGDCEVDVGGGGGGLGVWQRHGVCFCSVSK